MLPFKLIYHEGYDLCLGAHVFPSEKYRLIRERLLEDGFATEEDFLTPEPASDEDLLLVHDRAWVIKLRDGTLGYHELMKLEIPYSQRMVDAFWLAAGGTTLAAREALRSGFAFNIGGGFHHAFPGHGEGFCAIHDVGAAIRKLQQEGAIRKAMVVDVDVHHGNGTAGIFASDPSVYTLSIHQLNNYPYEKPPSTVDIHLADGVGDEEYLEKLEIGVRCGLENFRPDLMMYVGGTDPYREDQLGGLNLTIAGLRQRDETVFRLAKARGVPVASTLAGGYAVNVDDTVTIHANTAKAMAEVCKD
ncbi:MAG: histone deacetylase [Bryobacteraceae bacterium]